MNCSNQKPLDWTRILPPEYLQGELVVGRNLYADGRPGYVGCMFQNWAKLKKQTYGWRYSTAITKKPSKNEGVYGVSYALAGEAILLENGKKKHHITPGCIFHFYNFRKYRNRFRLFAQQNFLECSLFIDADTGKPLARIGILPSKPALLPGIVQPMLALKYRDLLESIRNLHVPPMSVLRQAIGVLEAIYSRAPMPKQDDLVARACALLREHSEPSFSVRDAAIHLGLPYNYFRRKFREQKGVSPGSFQLQERMIKARNLLEHQSVKEVAQELGYTSPFLFSGQFKQHVGVSPSVFQARYK